MASGASLTISRTEEINKAVSATNGNAGGIVGKMEKDAKININDNITLNQTVTATGSNAGGIVGSATDINFIVAPIKISALQALFAQQAVPRCLPVDLQATIRQKIMTLALIYPS